MKQAAAFSMLLIIVIIIVGLCQAAMYPADFSGQWYASESQSLYLFQEGIIYCAKNVVPLDDGEYISGAYSYCSSSVYLFAEGIAGLETGKELYLVHSGESSLLCECEDGSGTVYFIRYHQ